MNCIIYIYIIINYSQNYFKITELSKQAILQRMRGYQH